jgi:hypothetical protein
MIRQGFQMPYRQLTSIHCAANLFGMAVTLAGSGAEAKQITIPRDEQVTYMSHPTASASVQDIANPPVVEYESSGDQTAQIDPRAKSAWLSECRRRANLGGIALTKDERETSSSAADAAKAALNGAGGYDYCEAYLDDYYRNYAQTAVAGSYTYQSQALPQPAQLSRNAPAQQAQLPYEEIVTEEYIPIRTHTTARSGTRQQRDKRIRLYPR